MPRSLSFSPSFPPFSLPLRLFLSSLSHSHFETELIESRLGWSGMHDPPTCISAALEFQGCTTVPTQPPVPSASGAEKQPACISSKPYSPTTKVKSSADSYFFFSFFLFLHTMVLVLKKILYTMSFVFKQKRETWLTVHWARHCCQCLLGTGVYVVQSVTPWEVTGEGFTL